jgi:hypothetical protein
MPQIKEYTQQVGIEGGFSTISINPSIEGQQGRAIQQAGAAVGNVADTMMQIAESKEISDNAEKISGLRLKYTERLMNEVNTGQLSLDKLNEDFDNELAQAGDGITTRGASDYFRKSGQALKDSLSMDAMKAQAEITSVKIKNNVIKSLDTAQQTLLLNPSKLADVKNQFVSDVRAMTIDGKLIDSKVAEKMIMDGNKELDVAQFRGLYKAATSYQQLDGLYNALRTPAFSDRQFDDETIRKLEGEIITEKNRRDSQEAINERLLKKQEEERQNSVKWKILKDFENGVVDTNYIVDNIKDKDEARTWLSWVGSASRKSEKEMQSGKFLEIMERINLPDGDERKIYSDNQLLPFMQKEQISYSDYKALRRELGMGADNKYRGELRKNFMKAAEQAILKPHPVTKAVSAANRESMSNFVKDFQEIYDKKKEEGLTDEQLFTAGSKDNIFSLIDKYRKAPNEIIRDNMKYMRPQKNKAVDKSGKQVDVNSMDVGDILQKLESGDIKPKE